MKEFENKLLELCQEIEKLPASEQQTKTITMATDLLREIQKPSQEKNQIILFGHVHEERDFWIEIHLPNSGMILDLKKSDVTYFPPPLSTTKKGGEAEALEELYKFCCVAFDEHEQETGRAWKSKEFTLAMNKAKQIISERKERLK